MLLVNLSFSSCQERPSSTYERKVQDCQKPLSITCISSISCQSAIPPVSLQRPLSRINWRIIWEKRCNLKVFSSKVGKDSKRHLGNIDCSQALRRPTWSTTQICSQSGSWGPASIYQTKCLKYLETWYLQILNTSKHSFIQFYRATPPCLTIFTSFHYYTIILVCLFEKSNFIGIPEHVVTFFLIQFSEQRHHVWQDYKLSLFYKHISLFVWKVRFHWDTGTCSNILFDA